jgi:formylglycine-generating enzyme required for sulfatase activity
MYAVSVPGISASTNDPLAPVKPASPPSKAGGAAKTVPPAQSKTVNSGKSSNTTDAKKPDVKVNPIDGAEMVNVPAGEFTMGSDDGYGFEKPSHKVYLDGYWIYKTAVTVAQYRKFCDATGHALPAAPSWGWQDNYPIVNVTWNDATDYAKWANATLPTEALWEKAARGSEGRMYPWGNFWDRGKSVNSADTNSYLEPRAVGSIADGASPCGALDMAGNVWQWCSDWFSRDTYANEISEKKSAVEAAAFKCRTAIGPVVVRNPAGPDSGEARVIRGGCWKSRSQDNIRTSYRDCNDPSESDDTIGFRCVMPADK